ncbi:hypothetical protein Tco_1508513 [Tanacetum coccineum]
MSYASVMTTITIVTPTVDTAAAAKEKPVEPSLFGVTSSSVGGTDPTPGGFSDRTGSDFLVGGIRTVIDPDTNLQKVYVPQWSVTNGSRLDDGRIYCEMVDEFAPPKFFASVRGMEHDQLFTEFNVGAALDEAEAAEAIRLCSEASKFEVIEKYLQDEMKTFKERNTILEKEKNDMDVKVTDLAASIAVREHVVVDLNTLEQLKKFQDDQMKVVNEKFDKLYTDFVEMALNLEEKFYPYLLTTISCRRCLLVHGMKLGIIKFLNSPEYLSALGAAIGKAIEKGMQDGLAAVITYGNKGRELTDVAAHNPSAEVDYVSALQQLQDVNFSLLADLKSNKDASVETVINILRLEDPLAEKLGLSELQPYVDQLMDPIHRSPDQVILGASALSLALDVSSSRVRKIKENIANHRSALHDVFVPLAEPLSITALTGT